MGLDEFEIIEAFFAPLTQGVDGAFALKDDAAKLPPAPDEEWVVTTDMLVAGAHFFADDPAHYIAAKSLAVNLSDLAAKGAIAKHYLLSMALPADENRPDQNWLKAFQAGLKSSQQEYQCLLLGGDLVATKGPLTVSITAFGSVATGRMVLRSGAAPGDKVFVTGTIGDGALGLKLRENPTLCDRWALPSRSAAYLLEGYLNPQPRCQAAQAVRHHASAAMDISDGLVGDLQKLCKASSVGAEITVPHIPLSDPAKDALQKDPALLDVVLTGGDDYEILATIPPKQTEGFRHALREAGVQVSEIGSILAEGEGIRLMEENGKERPVLQTGYTHF